MRIRIKEAREVYKQRTGKKLTQKELAFIVWPELRENPRQLLSKMDTLNSYQSGRHGIRINMQIIERVALACGVDYNFLIINNN